MLSLSTEQLVLFVNEVEQLYDQIFGFRTQRISIFSLLVVLVAYLSYRLLKLHALPLHFTLLHLNVHELLIDHFSVQFLHCPPRGYGPWWSGPFLSSPLTFISLVRRFRRKNLRAPRI